MALLVLFLAARFELHLKGKSFHGAKVENILVTSKRLQEKIKRKAKKSSANISLSTGQLGVVAEEFCKKCFAVK